MGDGALSSDHVNYLVLRYLQEAGHGNAAKALYKDWNRANEYRDPEGLPFAPTIKQNELVSIVQDGLFHDQLQATVTKSGRRYKFLEAQESRPTSSQQPSSESRAQTSVRRMSSYAQPQDRDDFPTPAPKRARRSNGSEGYINGDPMEVDKRGQDDADSVSETGEPDRTQSETEPNLVDDEPPVEVSSAGTQTDKKTKMRTSTMYWTLDKPEPTSVLHTMWSPQPGMTTRLLTVGESLCRLYNVPSLPQDGEHISHRDPTTFSSNSIVSAACWHPSGRYATCAIDAQDDVEGHRQTSCKMFDWSVDGPQRFYDLPTYQMQPQGIALAIRYNPAGDLMFTVTTNGKRGSLDVWSSKATGSDLVVTELFEGVILDAAWTSDRSIVVCGPSLLEVYTLDNAAVTMNGLTNGHTTSAFNGGFLKKVYSHSTDQQWDKVRYDTRTGIVAASSVSDARLLLLVYQDESWRLGPEIPTNQSTGQRPIAIAFQPLSGLANGDKESPRRLAVAYDSGDAMIYSVSRDTCTVLSEHGLGSREYALALAWSPDGTLLAIASDESIKVWNVQAGTSPIVSWQAAPARWYQGNENNLPGDEDAQAEPSLCWNAEGKRLAFAVGRKIAIVSLLEPSS